MTAFVALTSPSMTGSAVGSVRGGGLAAGTRVLRSGADSRA